MLPSLRREKCGQIWRRLWSNTEGVTRCPYTYPSTRRRLGGKVSLSSSCPTCSCVAWEEVGHRLKCLLWNASISRSLVSIPPANSAPRLGGSRECEGSGVSKIDPVQPTCIWPCCAMLSRRGKAHVQSILCPLETGRGQPRRGGSCGLHPIAVHDRGSRDNCKVNKRDGCSCSMHRSSPLRGARGPHPQLINPLFS